MGDAPLPDPMDWPSIATAFKYDGSLRDIYIFNASLKDWEKVWEVLLTDPSRLSFSIDGRITVPPVDIGEAFRLTRDHSVLASLTVGKQRLNSHFFRMDEVEFDLDPRDVDGLVEAERLERFLVQVGRATSKEVRLTHENEPDVIIARYDAIGGQIEWMPPPS